MQIEEFKLRNAKAQEINSQIQRAQGSLDESKRQFEILCKQYFDTYGEVVSAENLDAILQRVAAEVEQKAVQQQQALDAAKNGVVIQKTAVVSGESVDTFAVSQGTVPSNGLPVMQGDVAPSSGAFAMPSGIPVMQSEAPVAQNTEPATAVRFGEVGQPVVQNTEPTTAVRFGEAVQPVYTAPQSGIAINANSENSIPVPAPINSLPDTAFMQADLKQPREEGAKEHITPAYQIPGWTDSGNDINYDDLMGGAFGG